MAPGMLSLEAALTVIYVKPSEGRDEEVREGGSDSGPRICPPMQLGTSLRFAASWVLPCDPQSRPAASVSMAKGLPRYVRWRARRAMA
ncbi:hypothetical protein SBBP1_730031 [Burkholderiales bacterium]|nr:hypothetical protein SBBP1_730031 [Burkholderiales bacterium]